MTILAKVLPILALAAMLKACAPAPETIKRNPPSTDKSSNQTPDINRPIDPPPGDGVEPTPAGVDPIDPDPNVPVAGVGPSDPGPVAVPDPDPAPAPAPINFTGGVDAEYPYIRLGEIVGWAVDKDNLKNFLTVNVYFDGDNKTGRKIGSTVANLVGVDDNNGGEHAFIFYVPKAAIDSKPHQVYIYAEIGGQEVAISSKMPFTMTVYKPRGGTAEAKYKEIGIAKSCIQCHSFEYSDNWHMLQRSGASGQWTETKNYMYEKMQNHRSVSGRAPCAVINCEKIKEWWRLEFAP